MAAYATALRKTRAVAGHSAQGLTMTGEPPSGTVTFLLTDLEGSTRLWEQDPEAMKADMVRHDELLEEAVVHRHGFIFARMGDGMAAAFASARDAVLAAAGPYSWWRTIPIGRARTRTTRSPRHRNRS